MKRSVPVKCSLSHLYALLRTSGRNWQSEGVGLKPAPTRVSELQIKVPTTELSNSVGGHPSKYWLVKALLNFNQTDKYQTYIAKEACPPREAIWSTYIPNTPSFHLQQLDTFPFHVTHPLFTKSSAMMTIFRHKPILLYLDTDQFQSSMNPHEPQGWSILSRTSPHLTNLWP